MMLARAGTRGWDDSNRKQFMPISSYVRIRTYRDLSVWQRAMDLVVLAYQLGKRLPKEELYGLISQIRRAATSIPANIAEGQGRRYTAEFLNFLGIANGSLMELETHIIASQRLGFVNDADVKESLEVAAHVGRMLAGLMRRLEERSPRTRNHRPPTTGHRPL